MNSKRSIICVIALVCGVILIGAFSAKRTKANQMASGSADCDRACLNGFVDQYLDALVAHDPSRLPTTKFVMYTQNGQHLMLGDGLWRTATGRGNYKFYIDDTHAEQVGFLGAIQESGQTVLIALRLKIDQHKISQIEMIEATGQMASGGAANLEKMGTPRKAFSEDIPAAERDRISLITTANKYFSGMQMDDGKADYSFFGDDCNRLENGMQTTNNMNSMGGTTASGQPRPAPSKAYNPDEHPTMYSAGWSCKDQFRSGLLHFVSQIRDRRYPVVDEEKGIVLGFGFFDHQAGNTRTFETPTGQTVTAGPVTPWTWEIAEVFKVRGGQLHEIEAVLTQSPYGMCSGWSLWDECRSDAPQY